MPAQPSFRRMHVLRLCSHSPWRQAGTARNLNKMLGAIGKDYKFFPRTFLLPADYTELKKEFIGKKGNKTFIVKPSRGCQGKVHFLDHGSRRANRMFGPVV
eukprot:6210325-Pleurochrysis_carterae.AAC.1